MLIYLCWGAVLSQTYASPYSSRLQPAIIPILNFQFPYTLGLCLPSNSPAGLERNALKFYCTWTGHMTSPSFLMPEPNHPGFLFGANNYDSVGD